MMKGSAYLEPRDCLLAIQSRIDLLTQGADPAPWYIAGPGALPGDHETPHVREMAIHQRANLTFFRAMIVRSLRGWLVDGGERWQIPGWAWADLNGDWRALIAGGDVLHPLVPPEFRRWARANVYVDRDEFSEWLTSDLLNDQSGFPTLPAAHDEATRPPYVTQLEPPDRPNVSLAHAVSWLAFGISLDSETLLSAIACAAFGDRTETDRRLRAAVERLVTAGTGGLPVYGKFVLKRGDYDVPLTAPIEPERLEDFRQFDVTCDGLLNGTGLSCDSTDPRIMTFARSFAATSQRYVDVKVERRGLVALRGGDRATAHSFEGGHRATLAAKVGRTLGSGAYTKADAPLLIEMRQLIKAQVAMSANRAAQMVAVKAFGEGTLESKAARLARAYRLSEANGAK